MKYWIVILCVMSNAAVAADITLSAKNALVIDANTNEILYEKNAYETKSIASITKLMTAIVILSSNLNMDEQIIINTEDVSHTILNGVAMKNNIPIGMSLTRAELLHFMLMNSANIAAVALARTYPGGYEVFIRTMNAEAVVLGMNNSIFVDSSGLNSGNVSTASDLYKLVKAASLFPLIQYFSTSKTFQTTGYYRNINKTVALHTTNRLVASSDWIIDVQKTGFTEAAGRCMVVMVEAGARKIVIIVLDAATNSTRVRDAINLKNYASSGKLPEVRGVNHNHTQRKVKFNKRQVTQ